MPHQKLPVVPLHETWEQTLIMNLPAEWRFDIPAWVEFEHAESGEVRRTRFFSLAAGRVAFRFTGTRTGTWHYRTESELIALHGHRGSIDVVPQQNPARKGFLTQQRGEWQIADFRGKPRPYRFHVYMDGVEFPTHSPAGTPQKLYDFEDPAHFENYLDRAQSLGFPAIFVHVGEPDLWMQRSDSGWEPNLRTFELLERMLEAAGARGVQIHLWKWKDQQRKATPLVWPGGINGPVDKQLQRYIAARLGPLPGWSLSYGFDLFEWVEEAPLNKWADFLDAEMGWPHALGARGHEFPAGKLRMASYDGFARSVGLTTSYAGPTGYREILEDRQKHADQPLVYEERHTYQRPDHQLDMNGTRRLLWWTQMAGGAGLILGYYPEDIPAYAGYPYPRAEQLRAFGRFWTRHAQLHSEPCPETAQAYALCGAGKRILYKQNAKRIRFDTAGLPQRFQAEALDTVNGTRLNLGWLTRGDIEFTAPRRSDWALALTWSHATGGK